MTNNAASDCVLPHSVGCTIEDLCVNAYSNLYTFLFQHFLRKLPNFSLLDCSVLSPLYNQLVVLLRVAAFGLYNGGSVRYGQ